MLWFLLALWLAVLALAVIAYRRGICKTPWHTDIAALGLLALATLGFFWRVVTGQNWMPADGGDLVSFLYPTYRFAAATLRGGAWPLWNPYLYAGAPHVGDIQAGFLYPPNLLLFLLWPQFPYAALQGLSIGHIWFAGAGMYLLLARGLRLGRVPALAGAVAFMFSDAFITHFGNLNFNAAASWLPWVFWAFGCGLAAAGRPWRLWNAALAGVLLAIATLAGHIQGTLFIILALGIYTAFWLWLDRAAACAARVGTVGETRHAPGVSEAPDAWWVVSRADLAAGERRPSAPVRARPRLGFQTILSSWRQPVFGLIYLLVCLLVVCFLSAPVLLPALELARHTARTTWNYTQSAGFSLSPAQLIGWLIPGFFGRGPQFHWGAWPRVEVGYLGILPLILAGLAIVLRRAPRPSDPAGDDAAAADGASAASRNGLRQPLVWAGLAAISLVLALGIYAIPHGWLTLLPGFGQLRAPARFVLVADFALAALAALGLEAALRPLAGATRQTFERAWRLVGYATGAVLAFGVPLAYLALLLTQDRDPAVVLRVSITLIAVATFAGLLVACLLWLTARRGEWARPLTLGWLAVALIYLDVASLAAYQDLGDRDPSAGFNQPTIAGFLAGQPAGPFRVDARTGIEREWQPDIALLYGLEDAGGLVNPLALADWSRYWEGMGSRSSRLYDLLNIRYLIGRKDVKLDWDKFSLAFDGDPKLNVYINRRALPRAFLVGQVQPVSSHEAAWAAIHAAGFDPATMAVVESAAVIAAGGRGEVTELVASPGRLTLRAVADGPALLVISQMWYPGWQARVDGGSSSAVLRTNYAFQGVVLPAGDHQVELRFDPPLWCIGLGTAAVTAAALLVAAAVGRRRRRGR